MKDKTDRRIFCIDQIVYIDKNGFQTFSDILEGKFAEKTYEDGEKENSIDNTVLFYGKYLKEHHKENWAEMNNQKTAWSDFAEFLKGKV